MLVVAGFRTSSYYYPGNLELIRVYRCVFDNGEPSYESAHQLFVRVGPGMFRETNWNEPAPNLDSCGSRLPAPPPGGYTRTYPCDAGDAADAVNRRITEFFADRNEPLPPCRT